jgi:PKD repeat protein
MVSSTTRNGERMDSAGSFRRIELGTRGLRAAGLLPCVLVLIVFACVGPAGCDSAIQSNSSSGPGSAPEITSFSAAPTSINSGASSTLSWETTGATSIAIAPGTFTSTSASGSTSVSPTATTTYTLTATNAAGSATSTLTITVTTAGKPSIASFTASPASITSGSSSTLSWATAGAASIAITPGTFTSASASGSTSVSPTATTTYTLTATNATGSTTSTAQVTVTASGGPLTITTTSCPGGTQGAAYAGCAITASGGTPPYTYSLSTDEIDYPPLPEGMSLNANTGNISSSLIGGQGTYIPEFVVKDSTGAQATQQISFAINGSNAFLAAIFPSTSIFHHRVDAATTGLPVDTSPAAPMYSGYLSETVKPFFGDEYANFPNGIPAIEVPYNQPDVSVTTTLYQSYFTSGPIPAYAPVEGTANAASTGGDRHVLVYLEAGGGNNPALYEMWQGIYEDGPWTDSSNALWPNVASNNLTAQGQGTSDAAGLPVGPLLANADEVIGTGTTSAPNGTIQHPIRFTLNHMLNYWVWPATQTAGVGSCTVTGGASIPVESEISQSSPPISCSMSGAAGEIYRLKASVATPSCAATSPQAAIIITAFRNYGIILADNGDSGGLIGTPDARWNNDDLSCIKSLTLSDFEPVNVSSLMVSNDSGATSH